MRKLLLYLIVSLSIGVVYVLPQALLHDYPNLLDITETIIFKDKISLTNTLYESLGDPTRMRIVYIAHRYLLSKSFGFNNYWLFLSHGALLGLSLFAIYLSLRVRDIKTYLVVVILILLSPATIDSYWRLGVAENLASFLLVVCLILNSKRSIFFYPLLIVLLFAKESAIFFIIGFIIFSIIRKQTFNTVFFIVSLFLYSLLLIPRLAQTQNELSYTSLFIIDPKVNLKILLDYIREFPLIFIMLFWANLFYINNHNNKLDLLFLLANMSILPLTVFNNIQAYYLLPTLYLTCLFFTNTLAKVKIGRFKSRKGIFLAMLVVLLIFSNTKKSIMIAEYWYNDYGADNALIEFILNNKTEKIHISENERYEYKNSLRYLFGNLFTTKDQARFIISGSKGELNTRFSGYICFKSFFRKRCKWFIVDKRAMAPQI